MPVRYFLIIAAFLVSHVSSSQKQRQAIIFYEVISGDSIKMFFNGKYSFSPKECSNYIRYIRINNAGDYNSYFEDRNQSGQLLSKGRYVEGKKHGYFESYYPNGNIQSKGNYDHDEPIGRWEFFFETGSPERIIEVTNKDIVLVQSFDENGNMVVRDGFGQFNGYVAGLTDAPVNRILTKGSIVNGKPDGTWTSTYSNMQYCKEEFSNGKFVKGVFPNAAGSHRKYNDRSFLNTFFLNTHLNVLEYVYKTHCPDTSMVLPETKNYSFDVRSFRRTFGSEIEKVIETAISSENKTLTDRFHGDIYLTAQFVFGENGKPKDFVLTTGWGHEFMDAIETSIRREVTFLAFSDYFYFHLKLSFPGGNSYQYSYHFSKNKSQ